MMAHQAEQSTILAAFGIKLLSQLQKVLVHQAHDMEAVGHTHRIGKIR